MLIAHWNNHYVIALITLITLIDYYNYAIADLKKKFNTINKEISKKISFDIKKTSEFLLNSSCTSNNRELIS